MYESLQKGDDSSEEKQRHQEEQKEDQQQQVQYEQEDTSFGSPTLNIMASQFCKQQQSSEMHTNENQQQVVAKSPPNENNGNGNILIESDHNEINLDSFEEANDFEEPIEVHAARPNKHSIGDGTSLADVIEASDESDSQGENSQDFIKQS